MLQNFIQPIVLGLTQGLTEFIPVSSSGHLVIVREVFGWSDPGVAYDAVLHLATLLAVLIYFRADWLKILRSFRSTKPAAKLDSRLLTYIGLTTIPAAIAGLAFKDPIEASARHLVIVASVMIFAGLMFLLIEKISRPTKPLTRMNSYTAWSIGIAQAMAILPGISRSGATIATGIYNGFKRADIARYSFLASVPIIILAGGYAAWQMAHGDLSTYAWTELAVAFVVALLSGLAAIQFMMAFLSKYTLRPFAYYRFIIGAGLLIYHFLVK